MLVATVLALALPPAASAAIPVTTTVDEQDNECLGDCSLRDALVFANRTGDTVTVPPDLPTGPRRARVLGATIQGTGTGARIIDGSNASRVLRVASGINEVSGVTITGGNGLGGQFAGPGGGILVQDAATLTLVNSAVSGNRTQTVGTTVNSGAGIAVTGTLSVLGSTIAGNQAPGEFSDGGGVHTSSQTSVTLTNTTVSGNSVAGSGGGVYILTGTLRTQNVTFARNQALDGGALNNSDGTAILVNTIVATACRAAGATGLSARRVITTSMTTTPAASPFPTATSPIRNRCSDCSPTMAGRRRPTPSHLSAPPSTPATR